MAKEFDRKIVFEDGSEYYGYSFGARADRVCEAVFNTSPVGYQEIVSDPSYTGQLVAMTYPVVGSCGVCDEDYETKIPALGALAVRDYNDQPSNFRCTKTLSAMMEEYGIPGIYGIDTRKLARSLRDEGSRRCILCAADMPAAEAVEAIKNAPVLRDAVKRASSRMKWYSKTAHPKYDVAVVDCGVKLSVVRSLNKRGCNVTVLPYNASAEEVLAADFDGVLFSDGPGDPRDAAESVELMKGLLGKVPVFGTGLGHLILAAACGGKINRLKFGHHGGNYPVRDVKTGKIEITAQNTLYAADERSLAKTPLTVTHVNVLDNTADGLEYAGGRAFSVQYAPDAAAYERFTALMEENRNA